MSKTYQYIGEGRGVPGLPHRLTDLDAMKLGVEEMLDAAIKAKIYELVKTAAVKPAVENKAESSAENDEMEA